MKLRSSLIAALLFVLGVAVGFAARKGVDPSTYRGKSNKEAGKALLKLAETQAGKGSWERIAVGRIYYLAGMKAEGQALFDSVTSHKPEGGDWFRIGRVYAEAKEWNKARDAFENALKKGASEKDWAEAGAYYLLNGDRKTAEDYFDKSFKLESDEVWATVSMAAGYLGVQPQP